jgi:hypothetical protein
MRMISHPLSPAAGTGKSVPGLRAPIPCCIIAVDCTVQSTTAIRQCVPYCTATLRSSHMLEMLKCSIRCRSARHSQGDAIFDAIFDDYRCAIVDLQVAGARMLESLADPRPGPVEPTSQVCDSAHLEPQYSSPRRASPGTRRPNRGEGREVCSF